ncbi:hypothetical protein ACN4EK_06515 [Pantanalinema rosaneae CENA516]|uniref:hypothetical protein n=1 Tax=Pantanalinema rosaneae TaxID=1620701 RepID=UPI003D6E8BAF
MTIVIQLLLFLLMLAALLGAMVRMAIALDEADIGRFLLWICIASVIAGIPSRL